VLLAVNTWDGDFDASVCAQGELTVSAAAISLLTTYRDVVVPVELESFVVE
jgi:hypothetical protein